MGRKRKNTKNGLFEISHYKLIRNFIKALLFSPSMNRKTMCDTGIIRDKRTFHNRLKNINLYMKDKVSKYKVNNTKYNYILNDLYQYPTNYFADTYMYASYNEEDLFYYVIYMQIINQLHSYKPYFCYNDIEAAFPENLQDIVTVNRRKFNDLKELGIIELKNIKKYSSKHYFLTNDIFAYNKNNFLDNLLNMVIFFFNHHYLSIPGYHLSKTINQYKLLNYDAKSKKHFQPENDSFVYRYVPKFNTLDNNILWNILQAIKEKYKISFTYTLQNGENMDYNLIPLKVVIEYEYGRQYCYGYDEINGNYYLSRIDMMDNLKILEEKCNNEEIYLNFDKDFNNKWMIADNIGIYNIKIYFHFPAEKRRILKRNLENTMRFGTIIEDADGQITFDITVSNYKELIPWINSFGEYAIVDKNTCPELYEEIKNHNNKLREIYGLI